MTESTRMDISGQGLLRHPNTFHIPTVKTLRRISNGSFSSICVRHEFGRDSVHRMRTCNIHTSG